MKLNEAVTVDDFVKVYIEKFGEKPQTSLADWGFVDDFINAIVTAVQTNEPIEEEMPPLGADL